MGFNTKVACAQAFLVLIGIVLLTTSRKTHGCSLKIHRVESELLAETAHSSRFSADRAANNNFLIASKRIFKLRLNFK